jgi:hypothetical protein
VLTFKELFAGALPTKTPSIYNFIVELDVSLMAVARCHEESSYVVTVEIRGFEDPSYS